jgi:hypothetical protein
MLTDVIRPLSTRCQSIPLYLGNLCQEPLPTDSDLCGFESRLPLSLRYDPVKSHFDIAWGPPRGCMWIAIAGWRRKFMRL